MNKYQRSKSDRDQLGKGGNCIAVERWCLTETREPVAAKLVDIPRCARRETKALQLAKAAKVPRVVQLIDVVADEPNTWLVLEYLDGISLSEYTKWRAKQNFYDAAETRMVTAATALIQTLCELHQTAKLAHLDLSLANIMLVPDASNAWEKLRLLDFGLSEPFQPSGPCSNSVQVPGSTLPWASPEVLQSMSVRPSGPEHIKYIDGAAADVWAAGSLLYSVLTGVLPFPTSRHVHGKSRRLAAQRAQESWIAAVRHAKEKGVAVSHTLLDNVRACSSTPDAAVAFFCAVLNPSPTDRLTSAQALDHPYLRCAVHQMQASYQSPTTPASATPSRSDSHTPGTDILGRLASVPSYGFNMMKSLVSQAMPGNNSSSSKARMRDMARYFPDYTHPSSDAELLAFQPPNDAAMPLKETPTDVKQLMAGMNQLRGDFNLGSPPAASVSPVAAVPPEPHPILHAKAPPNTDSAAAALHLQRQLYPASPLSAGSGFIPALHSAHVQPFGAYERGSEAASGQQHEGTPAQMADESMHNPPDAHMNEPQLSSTQASCSILHTVEGQDASAEDCATVGSGSCEGGSDAASGQQHGGTSAQMAVESLHNPPDTSVGEPQLSSTQANRSILHIVEGQHASAKDGATAGLGSCEGGSDAELGQQHGWTPAQMAAESVHDPPGASVDEAQPGSTPASRSILQTVEGQDASAKDGASAGSADSAAQPPAADSGTSKEQEEEPQSVESALLLGGTVQDVVEQRHSEMQQIPMTKAEAEQASCLLTVDAIGDSGDSAAAVGDSGVSAPVVEVSGHSTAAVGDSGDSASAVGDSGVSAAAVGDSGDSAAPLGDSGVCAPVVEVSGHSAAAVGDSGDSAAAVAGSVCDALVSQEASVNCDTHEDRLRSHPRDIEPEEEEVVAGAQPNQSMQSPSLHSPAHVQLPNQHSDALKNARDTDATASQESSKSHALRFCYGFGDGLDVMDPSAHVQLSNQHACALKFPEDSAATASEEPLKSHALQFCHGFDDDSDVMDPSADVQLPNQHLGALKNAEHIAARASEESFQSHALHFFPGFDDDLDVLDPCDVADAGPVSNHSCPGLQDALHDPDPYPYLDENAPLQQAFPAQVPLHRVGNRGSRTHETQAQRRGGGMLRLGWAKAFLPLPVAAALALAALRLAAPSPSPRS